jgi:hypothetical protein
VVSRLANRAAPGGAPNDTEAGGLARHAGGLGNPAPFRRGADSDSVSFLNWQRLSSETHRERREALGRSACISISVERRPSLWTRPGPYPMLGMHCREGREVPEFVPTDPASL